MSMVTSAQALKKVFYCPEESNFYSQCLESLVVNDCNSGDVVVEFGSGDGSPVIKSLLRTNFDGTIHGFEINYLAAKVARTQIQEYELSDRYIIHNSCFFSSPLPQGSYLISNPPYLPAEDDKIYQPLLHGGRDGSKIARQLLSLSYENVLLMVSSYSHPVGLINYALNQGYTVANFMVSALRFGYYSSEPKVKSMIAALREKEMAFYSSNIYLLAGVLFTKQRKSGANLSQELIELMTSL